MREWNQLYPKEVELFSKVVNERDAALDEVERLRSALAMFANPARWRETDDRNSDGWTIKVWVWSTIDVPWQTAQQILDPDKET